MINKTCKEWLKNPTINPITHRKISPRGQIYKKFKKDCTLDPCAQSPPRSPPTSPTKITKKCEEWLKNPNINPITKREIKNNGPVYKKLKIECNDLRPGADRADPCAKRRRRRRSGRGSSAAQRGGVLCTQGPDQIRSIIPIGAVIVKKKKLPLLMLESFLTTNNDNDEIFKNRMETGARVIENLKKINANQWTMCMTGSRAAEFKNYFKDTVEIGKGTFGQIYLSTLDSDKIIVKEANLKKGEETVLRKNVSLNDKNLEKLIETKKKKMPREHKNLTYVNELLLSKKCPNFLYTYKTALCDGCQVIGLFTKKPSPRACYVTFMEPADFDLRSIERINVNQQFSALYQLLCSVYSIHHYYALYHMDIKSDNVLIKRIKPGGYFKYVIDDKTIYVENAGLLVFLADFGVATSLSPKYSSLGFYGTRNAEVVKRDSEGALWNPFETKYFADYEDMSRPKISNPVYIKWIDNRPFRRGKGTTPAPPEGSRRKDDRRFGAKGIPGTFNRFGKMNIFPDICVDLYDNRRFPCFEFFNDIQDTIRIFIGGPQMFQDGTHPGINNLDKNLKVELKTLGFLKQQESMYYINGSIKYVLAEEMLWELYKEPRKIDYIIDTYHL